ncbi:MAG: ParA family protein [Cyclobacteriaceae bacterium]
MNWKGGVGKTSSTLNISYSLSRLGFRVLMIDLDPQENLSSTDKVNKKPKRFITDCLQNKELGIEPYTFRDNLDICHMDGSKAYDRALVELDSDKVDGLFRLGEKLEEAGILKKYDFIFLDTAPGFNMISRNALLASDYILIPSELSQDSIDGAMKLQNEVKGVSRFNPGLEILGMFVIRPKLRTIYQQSVKEYSEDHFKGHMFTTKIRENIRIGESKTIGGAVLDYYPEATSARDYVQLSLEIIERLQEKKALPGGAKSLKKAMELEVEIFKPLTA